MNPACIVGQLGHSVEVFFRHYVGWINGESNDSEMKVLMKPERFLKTPQAIQKRGKSIIFNRIGENEGIRTHLQGNIGIARSGLLYENGGSDVPEIPLYSGF